MYLNILDEITDLLLSGDLDEVIALAKEILGTLPKEPPEHPYILNY